MAQIFFNLKWRTSIKSSYKLLPEADTSVLQTGQTCRQKANGYTNLIWSKWWGNLWVVDTLLLDFVNETWTIIIIKGLSIKDVFCTITWTNHYSCSCFNFTNSSGLTNWFVFFYRVNWPVTRISSLKQFFKKERLGDKKKSLNPTNWAAITLLKWYHWFLSLFNHSKCPFFDQRSFKIYYNYCNCKPFFFNFSFHILLTV